MLFSAAHIARPPASLARSAPREPTASQDPWPVACAVAWLKQTKWPKRPESQSLARRRLGAYRTSLLPGICSVWWRASIRSKQARTRTSATRGESGHAGPLARRSPAGLAVGACFLLMCHRCWWLRIATTGAGLEHLVQADTAPRRQQQAE